MGDVSSIPVVSQIKSLIQVMGGDVEGARRTQEYFSETCPVVSQLTSAGHAIGGDTTRARQVQEHFAIRQLQMLDGLPVVGHIKGGIHYACGDHDGGDQAMKSASRSVALAVGGVTGAALGGPAGAVLGGVAAGQLMDGMTTGIDSVVHGCYKPNGAVYQAVTDMSEMRNPAVAVFDIAEGVAMDGLGGFAIGKGVNTQKLGKSSCKSHGQKITYTCKQIGEGCLPVKDLRDKKFQKVGKELLIPSKKKIICTYCREGIKLSEWPGQHHNCTQCVQAIEAHSTVNRPVDRYSLQWENDHEYAGKTDVDLICGFKNQYDVNKAFEFPNQTSQPQCNKVREAASGDVFSGIIQREILQVRKENADDLRRAEEIHELQITELMKSNEEERERQRLTNAERIDKMEHFFNYERERQKELNAKEQIRNYQEMQRLIEAHDDVIEKMNQNRKNESQRQKRMQLMTERYHDRDVKREKYLMDELIRREDRFREMAMATAEKERNRQAQSHELMLQIMADSRRFEAQNDIEIENHLFGQLSHTAGSYAVQGHCAHRMPFVQYNQYPLINAHSYQQQVCVAGQSENYFTIAQSGPHV